MSSSSLSKNVFLMPKVRKNVAGLLGVPLVTLCRRASLNVRAAEDHTGYELTTGNGVQFT